VNSFILGIPLKNALEENIPWSFLNGNLYTINHLRNTLLSKVVFFYEKNNQNKDKQMEQKDKTKAISCPHSVTMFSL